MKLPNNPIDPVLVRLCGQEYAEDAKRRDDELQGREQWDQQMAKYRRALRALREADTYAEEAAAAHKLALAAGNLAQLKAHFGDEVTRWW